MGTVVFQNGYTLFEDNIFYLFLGNFAINIVVIAWQKAMNISFLLFNLFLVITSDTFDIK